MAENPDLSYYEYDADEWEKALTLNVGTSYICRSCGHLVMVTKGGIGKMEHSCCGKPMEKVECTSEGETGE